jgi:hypothetical protein
LENREELESMIGSTSEPKKQKNPRGKQPRFTYQELMLKHERFFKLITYFFKSDVSLDANEFVEESKDLSRIAQDFELIAKIIAWLDPVFYLGGILGKVLDVAKGRKPNVQKQASDDKTAEGDTVSDSGGNLLDITRRTSRSSYKAGQGDNTE